MATSKAKHPIDLTQLQRHRVTPKPNGKTGTGDKPETVGLMPVKAHIYHCGVEQRV